jgi:serine/threonine protein kinase
MGVVWEAWDERLHRAVAVKQLHAQLGLSDDEAHLANERAMREARITARLDHPNAVPVFDVVEHAGQPCLIMQFLPSKPLSAVLKERGRLPFGEVARIGGQVASALAAAHRLGIVHRDVKPGNVLIAEDGTARISDFGISHALGDVTLTSTGMVHGTPAYLAPEVARGADSSFSSDVFGLGATLYAAVEGAPPFGSNQNSIALLYKVASGEFDPPDPDGPLTPLLTQMLAPDPADRPVMGDVAYALARSTDAPPVPPPTRDVTTRVQPTVPRSTPWGSQSTAAASDQPTAPYSVASVNTPPRSTPPASTPPLPVAPVVAATAAASGPPTQPPAPPSAAAGAEAVPTGRRRSRLTGALVALVVLVAVAALLVYLAPWRDDGVSAAPGEPSNTSSPSGSAADPSPRGSASTSASASAESTPSTRASRSASSSPSASASRRSPSATPTPTRTASSSAPPTGTATAAQLRDAVTGYYAQMPGDTDAGWERLTASYQREQTASKASYERFWGAIDRVTVSQAEGTPPDRVEATVTYYLENGRVSRERTSYQLVNEDGVLKINDTRVISSG